MKYSLSLHSKRKYEKNVGACSCPTAHWGGRCPGRTFPGWQLSLVAVVLGGSCPRIPVVFFRFIDEETTHCTSYIISSEDLGN